MLYDNIIVSGLQELIIKWKSLFIEEYVIYTLMCAILLIKRKNIEYEYAEGFFEIGCDKTLFDGLKISREKALCDKYMGSYPVISISLKNASSDTFEMARKKICSIIGDEASRFLFFAQSDRLSEIDRRQYQKMTE